MSGTKDIGSPLWTHKKPLLIYGAGRYGRSVVEILQAARRDAVGFLDDNCIIGAMIDGLPVLGRYDYLGTHDLHHDPMVLIIAIGDAQRRLELARAAAKRGWDFATVAHPSAVIAPQAWPQAGTVVFPGAIIGVGAKVGMHCVINNGASVGHEATVHDGASINDGVRIGGGVVIGEAVWLGMNAVVAPDVTIGARTIVGAGAVVLENLPADVTAVGAPARVVKQRSLLDAAVAWPDLSGIPHGLA